MSIAPAMRTRLEKAAADTGFDVERPEESGWIAFASSHAPVQIWLSTDGDGRPLAALSRADVASALAPDLGAPAPATRPPEAKATLVVPDVPALDRLLRRAFQLARTLPDEILREFERQTAHLPRTTEAERLVVQRVGQDLFRERLLEYWEGRCPVTGLAVPGLLRASHIKPWADCGTDAERLDVYNGLLLSPNLDAAFDRGFATFADDGRIVVSAALGDLDRAALGLRLELSPIPLAEEHRKYLSWHRARVFKGPGVWA